MNHTDYTTKALINRQNRKRQVRRHRSALIVSLFMIITVSILLISFSTEANDTTQSEYKYYTSIQIREGDTLWSIANVNFDPAHYKDINEYVSEVMKLNTLYSDDIVAGHYVIVPYYTSEFVSD